MRFVLRGQQATDKAATLGRVSVSEDGWETTFMDYKTGALWLLDYPDSSHHGGGTARLSLLSDPDEANSK